MKFNRKRYWKKISFLEFCGIVKPSMVQVILITITFSLTSLLFTKTLIKPTYESNATMIVNNRREEKYYISSEDLASARNLATVYGIVIKSNAVMEPVIQSLGYDLSMEELSQKISVSPVEGTHVIEVSVKDNDPKLAKLYADKIVEIAPSIIIDMVEAGSVKVVSYPQEPTNPISPNIKLNVLLAGLLGFILSVGLILVRFLLDKTFRNAESIEVTLGIPVIGVIPKLDSIKGGM